MASAGTRVVDLRRAGLGEITREDGALVIGATVTYAQLAAAGQPLLATMAPASPVAHRSATRARSGARPATRSRLRRAGRPRRARRTLRIASARGTREVAAAEFFRDAFATALEAGELLAEIVDPAPAGRRALRLLQVEARRVELADRDGGLRPGSTAPSAPRRGACSAGSHRPHPPPTCCGLHQAGDQVSPWPGLPRRSSTCPGPMSSPTATTGATSPG